MGKRGQHDHSSSLQRESEWPEKQPRFRHDSRGYLEALDSETERPNGRVVKRGKELHEPDRMYLNPNQIILVEPVGTNSKVAKLIAEAK